MRRVVVFAALVAVAGATLPAEHDAPFYENNVTLDSSWERPSAMPHFAEDGRPFWVVDGVASWEPADAADGWRPRWSPDGHPFFESLSSGAVVWERPPSMGWTARSSKRSYYHNVVSGQTVDERPAVLGHLSEEHEGVPFFVGADGEPTWDAPEASAWETHHSEEHDRPFYHNPKTGDTVWEPPPHTNAAWQRWFHEVEL